MTNSIEAKATREAIRRIRRRIYPTGLNPKEPPPGSICDQLVRLDFLEELVFPRTFRCGYNDKLTNIAKEELLPEVKNLHMLAKLGPHLGRRRNNRHSRSSK
ncbi:hypothetical protein HY385_02025 [Candidatus Daviesbacteria bacterium]|nr:hypothetical protein [Candidatus Daviesbacteria bacterium]